MVSGRPSLSYILDPRFRGGTASSFVAELDLTAPRFRVSVHALSESYLRLQEVGPAFEAAIDAKGLNVSWDDPVVSSDIVVIHNPVFLSTIGAFPTRIVTRDLVVVTHENFERPGRAVTFDFAAILARIDRASVCVRKWLAPVSSFNRARLRSFLATDPGTASCWRITPADWTNVVSAPMIAPTQRPRDRRGRLSRAGLEKFPPLAAMERDFPVHAEANVIMGADYLAPDERARRHWRLLPFGALPVGEFFGMIDFMAYHTAPTWTESFGRVIAEAICAGKVVIAGPEAAEVFGDAVIVAKPGQADPIIARLVANPAEYAAHVRRAQSLLASAYGPQAFLSNLSAILPEPVS